MICSNCGKKVAKNSKYCSFCSKEITNKDSVEKNIILIYFDKFWIWFMGLDIFNKILLASAILTFLLFLIMQTRIIGYLLAIILFILVFVFKKTISKLNVDKMIIVSIGVIVIFTIFITNTKFDKFDDQTNTISSIVSHGVNLDDLGNIVNGQYFFDDGKNQYYSTFDEKGETHIYMTNKSTGKTKIIFNGFGWSFVVNDGWLYFSGNQGTEIDATYNLFRIKTDGTNLEVLNTQYTYNMNIYKDWLYYIRKANYGAEEASIYRSKLDGSSEESVIASASGISVIYSNKLYYLAPDGYIYATDIDGGNGKLVINEKVSYFIIGQGKIIYIDELNNIKSSDINGSNIKLVRASDGSAINKINSYKDTIIYVIGGNYLQERLAYSYMVYSINANGTNDKLVYSGVSYGYYVNVLDNKLFVLDYAEDLLINEFIAITRNMNLDGSNIKDLYRK